MSNQTYFSGKKIEELLSGKRMAYSIKEVAEMLGVCTGHLRNENGRGKLRFVKSNRRILILDSELRRYIDELQVVEQAA